jgi:hypothetical protein
VFGPYDENFIDYVNNAQGMPDALPLRDPYLLWDSDISHFGASFGAVVTQTFHTDETIGFPDFGSWGGDLLSALGGYEEYVLRATGNVQAPRSWGNDNIGKGSGYFNRSDAIADIDAVVLGRDFVPNRNQSLVAMFKNRYASPATAKARYTDFYQYRFDFSAVVAYDAAWAMFDQMAPSEVQTVRDGFWVEDFRDTGRLTCFAVPEDRRSAIAWAWVDFLNNLTS